MQWVLAFHGQEQECRSRVFWAPLRRSITVFLQKYLQMTDIKHLVCALCSTILGWEGRAPYFAAPGGDFSLTCP